MVPDLVPDLRQRHNPDDSAEGCAALLVPLQRESGAEDRLLRRGAASHHPRRPAVQATHWQQSMSFERTLLTRHGPTQAGFRILYLWPEGSQLTPTLTLVPLRRGKMMCVDHNRNSGWVGASSVFSPLSELKGTAQEAHPVYSGLL